MSCILRGSPAWIGCLATPILAGPTQDARPRNELGLIDPAAIPQSKSGRTSEKSSHSSHCLLLHEVRQPRPIRQITPSPTPQVQRVTASSVPPSPASLAPLSEHRYALTSTFPRKPIAPPCAQQDRTILARGWALRGEGVSAHCGGRERRVATLGSVRGGCSEPHKHPQILRKTQKRRTPVSGGPELASRLDLRRVYMSL